MSRRMAGAGQYRRRGRLWVPRDSEAYDPGQEAGYFLDMWADRDVSLDGSNNVSQWLGQASGATFANATAAQRPAYSVSNVNLNSKPSVNFVSGGVKLLTTNALVSANTAWTAFLFGRSTSATSQRRYILDTQTGRLILVQSWEDGVGAPTAGGVGFYDDTGLDSIAADVTGAQALVWQFSGGTGTMWRGNSLLGTAAYTARGFGGTTAIGGIYTAAGTTADFEIGRLLVFAGALDAAARARVLAWGSDYYAITL